MSTRRPHSPPDAHELLHTLEETLSSLRQFTEWLQAATAATDLAATEQAERMPDQREDGIL